MFLLCQLAQLVQNLSLFWASIARPLCIHLYLSGAPHSGYSTHLLAVGLVPIQFGRPGPENKQAYNRAGAQMAAQLPPTSSRARLRLKGSLISTLAGCYRKGAGELGWRGNGFSVCVCVCD